MHDWWECWPNYHHQSVLVVVIQSSLSSLFAIRTTFFSAIIKLLYEICFQGPWYPQDVYIIYCTIFKLTRFIMIIFLFLLSPQFFFYSSKLFVYYHSSGLDRIRWYNNNDGNNHFLYIQNTHLYRHIYWTFILQNLLERLLANAFISSSFFFVMFLFEIGKYDILGVGLSMEIRKSFSNINLSWNKFY